MQTRATLALLSSMHMDYLQIEKYRLFCSYGVIFFFFIPPPPRNVFAPISHSTFSHPRFSVHIAKVAGTVKAALKTFFTQMGKPKIKDQRKKSFTSKNRKR